MVTLYDIHGERDWRGFEDKDVWWMGWDGKSRVERGVSEAWKGTAW